MSGVTYRHPGLLAKTVTTLDVLSGGRAQLGIGAAWYEREHVGLGVPFPPLAERFERLEETLQICRQMWSDDDGPYEGAHYRLAETLCVPAPVSHAAPADRHRRQRRAQDAAARGPLRRRVQPHGVGPRRHRARSSTCCAPTARPRRRDPATVTRTVTVVTDPFADLDGFLTTCDGLRDLGVDEVVVMAGADARAAAERVVTEIVPRVAG